MSPCPSFFQDFPRKAEAPWAGEGTHPVRSWSSFLGPITDQGGVTAWDMEPIMGCKGRALKWWWSGKCTREVSVFELATGGARRSKPATGESVRSRDQLKDPFACACLSVWEISGGPWGSKGQPLSRLGVWGLLMQGHTVCVGMCKWVCVPLPGVGTLCLSVGNFEDLRCRASCWADWAPEVNYCRDPHCIYVYMYMCSPLKDVHPDQSERKMGWGLWCRLGLFVCWASLSVLTCVATCMHVHMHMVYVCACAYW